LCRERDDFPRYLRSLGIWTVTWHYDAFVLKDANGRTGDAPPTGDSVLADPLTLPFSPACFDLVVMPLGLPRQRWNAAGRRHLDVQRAIRRLIRPGGTLLLGFSNRLDFLRGSTSEHYALTPRRAVRLLLRAEYSSVDLYGAVPNLTVPEYIFPLTPQVLAFVLRSRYRQKLPARLLRWLIQAGFANFLPAYFAVASTSGDGRTGGKP